jgi:aspartate/methionine/tyrosine aminotransferase
MKLSDKASKIGESPTLKITSKVKAMKAEGIDVIDLGVGEPDFPTPENAKNAGIRAIEENFTKYTQSDGIPSLKEAIQTRLKEDLGLEYAKNEIIVSSGAKSSLYHLIQAVISQGDEVVVPVPYWVTYPHSISLAGGKPVYVPTREEDGFLLTPEQLRAAVTPKTKALILNNPSNPTGAAYQRDHLEALADVILEEDITVIADEIYEKLVYDDFKYVSFAALGDEIKKRTVIVNGVSKAYSMTGWRIGYAAGPAEVINGMAKIQSHSTSNPCSVSQKAAEQALKGPQYDVSKMISEFQRRRNYVHMRLQTIKDVSCFKSQGAFYLFPNFSAYFPKEFNSAPIRNSYGLTYFLLKEARVAVVPGAAFGSDANIRISYATSMENIEKGINRIIEALSKLKTAKKVKRVALNNFVSHWKKSVPVEPGISTQMRDALVGEMESQLSYDNYFEWNANINGVIVQLRTNVAHLYDFWIENWYPAQLEADLEPHGIIYAVDNIPGREPRAYYSSETKTGILVNANNYSPLRSLALGLVMDISDRTFRVHAVRGMSADRNGNAILLVGPKGTKKTGLFFSLLQGDSIRLHSNDVVFVRFSGKQPVADSPERKLFVPTNSVDAFSRLAPLFDNSKCENVILKKEDCQNQKCLQQDDCRLDRGSPFCYTAAKNAYSMLDPYWIEGAAKHTKRSTLSQMVILRNDSISPAVVKLDPEDAFRMLDQGESVGIRSDLGQAQGSPFFNPHLLVSSPEQMDIQRGFYRRLLEAIPCALFNSGLGTVDDLKRLWTGSL